MMRVLKENCKDTEPGCQLEGTKVNPDKMQLMLYNIRNFISMNVNTTTTQKPNPILGDECVAPLFKNVFFLWSK